MKNQENPNSERNSRIASYLISVAVHLLLLLLLMILISAGGGSQEGGRTADFGAIDVMVAEAQAAQGIPEGKPKTEPIIPEQPQPEKQPEPEQPQQAIEKIPPQRINPEDVPIPASDNKPVKPAVKPNQPETHEQSPEQPKGTPEGTQTGETPSSSEVRTTGEGGDKALNTKGTGRTDHEGTGTGVGPLPNGSFGLMDRVPECKKNDADNDSLIFAYEVTYKPGDDKPNIALKQVTAAFDSGTVQMTMRILKESFDPSVIPPGENKTYLSYVICYCGSNPHCELKNK